MSDIRRNSLAWDVDKTRHAWANVNIRLSRAACRQARDKSPATKVLLLSIPPRGEKPSSIRERHLSVNPLLAKMDDDGKTIKYVDLAAKFLQPDGSVSKDLMPDFFHFSDAGY